VLVEDDHCGILENSHMKNHFATQEEKLFKVGAVSFERFVTLLRQGVECGFEDVAPVKVGCVVAGVSSLYA
jgi:hypothetical protein